MISVRSPIAWSRLLVVPSRPRSAWSSGTLASTGSYFIVGGSSFRHPSKVWESLGRSLLLPTIFVGFCPHTSATSCPMAVLAPTTVPVATRFPLPNKLCRTRAANPVSVRTLVVYSILCTKGSSPKGWTYLVEFVQCVFLFWVVAATWPV